MSFPKRNSVPIVPQRILALLEAEESLKKLGVVGFNCNDFAVRVLFGAPYYDRMTIMERRDGSWELLLQDEQNKELALVKQLPDHHLLRWIKLLRLQLPGWVTLGEV
jgi:hypothetical protein